MARRELKRTPQLLQIKSVELKVTVHPQIGNFLQIFSVKVIIRMKSLMYKKLLKKIKYWQRNSGFKFWPEVKITGPLFSRINYFT